MSARVMVVDDSLMVRQQVSRALTNAGFDVVEAHDGLRTR
jgi:PleD family two-component response regulator